MVFVGWNKNTNNPLLGGILGSLKWKYLPEDRKELTYSFATTSDLSQVASFIEQSDAFKEKNKKNLLINALTSINPNTEYANGVISSFSAYERVVDIDFSPSRYFDTANIKLVGVQNLRSIYPDYAITLRPKTGDNDASAGYIFFDTSLIKTTGKKNPFTTSQKGSSNAMSFLTLHEIGHTLFLEHPHSSEGHSQTISDKGIKDIFGFDNERYTVMSYEVGGIDKQIYQSFGHVATPSPLDIAALQFMYGKNLETNKGTTIYQLADTDSKTGFLDLDATDLRVQLGEHFPNPVIQIGQAFFTIWDNEEEGDQDEIVYRGTKRVILNLNDAPLSTIDINNYQEWVDPTRNRKPKHYSELPQEFKDNIEDLQYNVGGFFSRIFNSSTDFDLGGYSIAHGVIIENASSSDGDDFLIGNQVSNKLKANGGEDFIFGGAGEDLIQGGDGDDELQGGKDNDLLVGDAGVDTAIYIGKSTDYDFVFSPDKTVIITDSFENRDGSDLLDTVEKAKFLDKTIDLTPGQDIIFAIDVSRSMKDDLSAVKEEIKKQINELFDSDVIDNRIAIFTFNDQQAVRSVLDFTTHTNVKDRRNAALKSIDENVSILNGGTEFTNHALLSTIKRDLSGRLLVGEWRANASEKKIILFSDEEPSDSYIAQQVADTAQQLGITIERNPIALTPVQEGEEEPVLRSSKFEGNVSSSFAGGNNSIAWETSYSSYNLSFEPNKEIDVDIPVDWNGNTKLEDGAALTPSNGIISLGKFSLSAVGEGGDFGAMQQTIFNYEMDLESSGNESLLKLHELPKGLAISFGGVNESRSVLFHTSHEQYRGSLFMSSPDTDAKVPTPVAFELLGAGKETDDGYVLLNGSSGWIPLEDLQEVELLARMYTHGTQIVFPLHYYSPTLQFQTLTDESVANLGSLNADSVSDTFGQQAYFHSNFKPNYGLTLDQAAYLAGYDSFEWYNTTTNGFTDADAPIEQSVVNSDGSLSFLNRPVVDEGWDKVEFETHLVGVDETNKIGSDLLYSVKWGSTFKEAASTVEDNLINYQGNAYALQRHGVSYYIPSPLEQDTFIDSTFSSTSLAGDSLTSGALSSSNTFSIPGDSLSQNDFDLNVDAFAAQPSVLL